jgi:hypothetical protein
VPHPVSEVMFPVIANSIGTGCAQKTGMGPEKAYEEEKDFQYNIGLGSCLTKKPLPGPFSRFPEEKCFYVGSVSVYLFILSWKFSIIVLSEAFSVCHCWSK